MAQPHSFAPLSPRPASLSWNGGLVLPGFHPDPTVCVDGDTAWMVTSSFEYFPALPIYCSRDLRHWEARGHAVADPSLFPALAKVPSGGGMFAPSLRRIGGEWHLACTLIRQFEPEAVAPGFGHFLLSAPAPEGPWGQLRWLTDAPFGIDPSFFTDKDGSVYVLANRRPDQPRWPQHRLIWIQRLDLASGRLFGERYDILDPARWHGIAPLGNMNTTEGPRLIFRHGSYFLLVAHGGTGSDHAVSIFTADRPTGPFRSCPANPILTHRDAGLTRGVAMVGHGDLFEMPGGKWWMSVLGTRVLGEHIDFLGREAFLVAVDWSGFWPIVNPAGDHGRLPPLAQTAAAAQWLDRFPGPALHSRWLRRRVDASREEPSAAVTGRLALRRSPLRLADGGSPAFLGFRQTDQACRFELELEACTQGETGLAVVRDERRHATWTLDQAGDQMKARLKLWREGRPALIGEILIGPGPWRLGFKSQGTCYTFFLHDAQGGSPALFSAELDFLAWETEMDFTGIIIGPYAVGEGSDFAHFTSAAYCPCN